MGDLGRVFPCHCRDNGRIDLWEQYLVSQTAEHYRAVSNGKYCRTVLSAAVDDYYSYYDRQLFENTVEKQEGARR